MANEEQLSILKIGVEAWNQWWEANSAAKVDLSILDFSAWEDERKFGSTFNQLIAGLELFHKG